MLGRERKDCSSASACRGDTRAAYPGVCVVVIGAIRQEFRCPALLPHRLDITAGDGSALLIEFLGYDLRFRQEVFAFYFVSCFHSLAHQFSGLTAKPKAFDHAHIHGSTFTKYETVAGI